jgi:hypothetical protein
VIGFFVSYSEPPWWANTGEHITRIANAEPVRILGNKLLILSTSPYSRREFTNKRIKNVVLIARKVYSEEQVSRFR